MQLSSPVTDIYSLFLDLSDVHLEKDEATQLNPLSLSIRFDRFNCTASEIVKRVMNRAEVIDFRIDEPSIEHIIRRVYEGKMDSSVLSSAIRGSA
ncbi:hypothetical protein D3C77_516270 [compost metagenome]